MTRSRVKGPEPSLYLTNRFDLSGLSYAGDIFQLAVSVGAEASTFAGIVRLVEAAQHSKAPMSRLTDRYAMVFFSVTVSLAGGAWFWTGDPIRALAVLVVATPCPLILAVQIAIISGVSRAAKLGILINSSHALENLARVRTLVIDKTVTLTHGTARLVAIETAPEFSDDGLLSLAASSVSVQDHGEFGEAVRIMGWPVPLEVTQLGVPRLNEEGGMTVIKVLGIDLGKNSCSVAGLDGWTGRYAASGAKGTGWRRCSTSCPAASSRWRPPARRILSDVRSRREATRSVASARIRSFLRQGAEERRWRCRSYRRSGDTADDAVRAYSEAGYVHAGIWAPKS